MNLPPQIQVLERGWLSSNNILIDNGDACALIDSGYHAHAAQTLLLLQHALGGKPLARLINTHCHSDHMGGNAALQCAYGCRTSIPVGEAPAIATWDDATLMLSYAGQSAERFSYDDTISAGDSLQLRAIARPVSFISNFNRITSRSVRMGTLSAVNSPPGWEADWRSSTQRRQRPEAFTKAESCSAVQRSACSGIGDRLGSESLIGMNRNR